MTEPTRGVYAVTPIAPKPTDWTGEAVCGRCQWPFGRKLVVRWRDGSNHKCVMLYGSCVRNYGGPLECPSCRELYYF